MAKQSLIPAETMNALKALGVYPFQNWLKEKKFKISSRKNFYEDIEQAVIDGRITTAQLNSGITELEENGNKKIRLMQANGFESMQADKRSILARLKRNFGITPVENYSVRVSAKRTPTFNYLSWDGNNLKIKYSELHQFFEPNYETGKLDVLEVPIYIIIVIDTSDGLTQVRFDSPGEKHTHKNDNGRSSTVEFEKYYFSLLFELFPDLTFTDINLTVVVRRIRLEREIPYLWHNGMITITGEAKLNYKWRFKTDIRDLPEYQNAVSLKEAQDWLTEDLSGYWKASDSDGALNQDLFMRISRKESELRVQRGCLEKELSYGIRKVREIQKGV